MSQPHDVLAVKVVPFSPGEVAEAIQPPLSEKVQQIIAASGVQSLQALTGSPSLVAAAVRAYWNIEPA
jgi:hypothetical protein